MSRSWNQSRMYRREKWSWNWLLKMKSKQIKVHTKTKRLNRDAKEGKGEIEGIAVLPLESQEHA